MMELNASNSSADQLNKSQWIWVVEDQLGSLLWVSLRDDTHYVGIFKSFDQYGNILLTDTVKKLIVNSSKKFSDVYCGNMLIRGESIAYFCVIDVDAYLTTFVYDSRFNTARLRQLVSQTTAKAAKYPVSTPLHYVEINEALKLLSQEKENGSVKPTGYGDMLGNDCFI